MPEFIVSWSAYGPSGRIEAESQEGATRYTEEQLWALGLETQVLQWREGDPGLPWGGQFVILKSRVKRYGDMSSFGVCVYPVGDTSFYDRQRDLLQAKSVTEKAAPPPDTEDVIL